MNKHWYPLALSMSVIGCGGSVDDGRPAATGGAPQYYYGPALISGGATSIDTGKPTQTGGMTPIPPYGVMPQPTGGAAAGGSGGNAGNGTNVNPPTSGGSTTIDAGTPATGGYRPLPVYMANLRLPAQDDGARHTDKYFPLPFEPRAGAKEG